MQEVLYKWPYNVCAIWIWKYTKLSSSRDKMKKSALYKALFMRL